MCWLKRNKVKQFNWVAIRAETKVEKKSSTATHLAKSNNSKQKYFSFPWSPYVINSFLRKFLMLKTFWNEFYAIVEWALIEKIVLLKCIFQPDLVIYRCLRALKENGTLKDPTEIDQNREEKKRLKISSKTGIS